jgi:hypothetical protein
MGLNNHCVNGLFACRQKDQAQIYPLAIVCQRYNLTGVVAYGCFIRIVIAPVDSVGAGILQYLRKRLRKYLFVLNAV